MSEIREQVSFACGCVVYRVVNAERLDINPCDEHITIANLSPRLFRRMVKWPPTEAMLGRAARQGRPVVDA